LLERLLQRHLQLGGNHLRQPVAFAVAQAHDATHIAHDGFRAHRAERDDLRHGVATIFLPRVFDDVRAPVVREININIRRIDALGIQEALEEQPVTDRINVRDLQQVGDNRAGGATARHARDAFAAPVLDEVGDDQEVGNEPGLLDDAKFELEPVNDRLERLFLIWILRIVSRQPLRIIHARDDVFLALRLGVNRVPAEQRLREQMPQITLAREMLRWIEDRIVQRLEIKFHVALLGDFERVRHGSGRSVKRAFISSALRR
jgi:hypothetical protein